MGGKVEDQKSVGAEKVVTPYVESTINADYTPLDVEALSAQKASQESPTSPSSPEQSEAEHSWETFGREHGYLGENGQPTAEGRQKAVDDMLDQLGMSSKKWEELGMNDLDLPQLSVGGFIRAIFGGIANFFKNLFRKKPKEESE